MERLMELQSRLRELTEARKDEWRRMGDPLPDGDSLDAGPETADPSAVGAASADGNGTSPEPVVTQASDAVGDVPLVEAAEVAVQAAEVAVRAAETGGPGAFARRRGLQAKAVTEALQRGLAQAGAVARESAETFSRQVAGRVRDLSGGIGTGKQPPRPRPGDPITAEELINDKSLSARLLGAAVLLVGVLVYGGVVLVQFGKLEIPWLDDNALPAATSRTPPIPGGAAAAVGFSDRGSDAAEENGVDGESRGDAPAAAEDIPGASPGEGSGSDSAPSGDAEQPASGEPIATPSASSGETTSPEVLEFTRLQGDLAFRVGEYELARADFEQGSADCGVLSERYAKVDSSHLVLSRVVARARGLPNRQEEAYEELSALLDGVLRHYSASGCGLDPSELPD